MLRKYLKEKYPLEFDKPNVHPIILQFLWNNHIRDEDHVRSFMQRTVDTDVSPYQMKNMQLAATRIIQAIKNNERITIFGDYDVDGITATFVLYQTLLHFYNTNVNYYIPSRDEGYGINLKFLDTLEPVPNVIITVDNGIKAKDVATAAKSMGIDFIITDHHLVDNDQFPNDAYCVVNPQQADCTYSNKSACGCLVSYKLSQAIASELEQPDFVKQFDDIVALATVADFMDLSESENRSIVYNGLNKMKNPNAIHQNLALLFEHAKIKPQDADVQTLGFSIIPPLNASSRMEHPRWTFDLLNQSDRDKAIVIADYILSLNNDRKIVQNDTLEQLIQNVKSTDYDYNSRPIIVEYAENVGAGILGLLAAGLQTHFSRPAIVLTNNADGLLSGSARSFGNVNIVKILDTTSHLLHTYGGHANAAGLSLKHENLDVFLHNLYFATLKQFPSFNDLSIILADYELQLSDISWSLYDTLQTIEPLGNGLEPVRFYTANVMAIPDTISIFGSNSVHLRFKVHDDLGNVFSCIAWRQASFAKMLDQPVDLIYKLQKDTYREVVLQLLIERIDSAVDAIDTNTARLKLGSKSVKRRL